MLKILNLNLRYLLYLIPYLLLLALLTYYHKFFFIFTFLVPWILIIRILHKDVKQKTAILICSLPIGRTGIVRGTYLSGLVIIAISTIYSALVYYLAYIENVSLLNLPEILNINFLPVILAAALIFPLHFQFGFDLDFTKGKFYTVLLVIPVCVCLMLLFIFPFIMDKDILLIRFIKSNAYAVNIIGLVFFAFSMMISEKCYEKREL